MSKKVISAKEKNAILTKKLQKIFDIYKESGARLWILDTDIYNTWSRFAENLKPILTNKNLKKLPNKISISSVKEKNGKIKYSLKIGNINVTPIKKKGDKIAAKSTTRQYLQEGSALSFINYSENDKIEDKISYSLNPTIWGLCDDTPKELNNSLLRSLANSLTSKDPSVINIGYSLLISLIYKTDKHIFFDIKNHKISTNKSGNDNVINFSGYEISTTPALEIIRHSVGEKEGPNKEIKGSSSTYKSATKNLLQEYDLFKIVDYIFNIAFDGKDISEVEIEPTNIDNQFNKMLNISTQKIEKARTHLRKNIIEARVPNENEPYSDLENSKLNEDVVKNLIVCHIYDVEGIKKEFLNKYTGSKDDIPLDYYINLASDPNNGIFLNPSAHKLFDNQTIWFDSDGKLCYKKSQIKTVQNAFGDDLDNVRIKPQVLTKEMAEFINKKWYNAQNKKKNMKSY